MEIEVENIVSRHRGGRTWSPLRRDTGPYAPSRDSDPCASSRDSGPCASSRNSDPCASSCDSDPCASSGDSDPCASSGDSDPCASSRVGGTGWSKEALAQACECLRAAPNWGDQRQGLTRSESSRSRRVSVCAAPNWGDERISWSRPSVRISDTPQACLCLCASPRRGARLGRRLDRRQRYMRNREAKQGEVRG